MKALGIGLVNIFNNTPCNNFLSHFLNDKIVAQYFFPGLKFHLSLPTTKITLKKVNTIQTFTRGITLKARQM